MANNATQPINFTRCPPPSSPDPPGLRSIHSTPMATYRPSQIVFGESQSSNYSIFYRIQSRILIIPFFRFMYTCMYTRQPEGQANVLHVLHANPYIHSNLSRAPHPNHTIRLSVGANFVRFVYARARMSVCVCADGRSEYASDSSMVSLSLCVCVVFFLLLVVVS